MKGRDFLKACRKAYENYSLLQPRDCETVDLDSVRLRRRKRLPRLVQFVLRGPGSAE